MRGIIFSEFLDFVEDRSGLEMVGDMVESREVPPGTPRTHSVPETAYTATLDIALA